MRPWSEVVSRIRAFLLRSREEAELDEELRFHVEKATAEYVKRGMPEDEARRRAHVELGGVERTKEEVREARGVKPLEDLVRDVRYALRTLGRNPGFTAAAVAVLALGIGTNASIFSAVNAVVLRPLPFPHQDRLYRLWESSPSKGWDHQVAAPANMLDWRERVDAFQDVGAYTDLDQDVLTGQGEPQLLRGADVTGNFFSVLGVQAEVGRLFRAEETWSDAEPVAVLSDQAWRTRFGADPSVVGRRIELDGAEVRVVGVVASRIDLPAEHMDLWTNTGWDRSARSAAWFRRAHWISPVARLKPGVSPETADAQLQAVVEQLQAEYPQTNADMGAGMTRLHDFLLGDTRAPLLVLLGAVGLLLLIACANVGTLLLVRASGRRREVAVRRALGAGKGRLVRQVLTESLVLSAFGGVAGLALGFLGTRVLERLQPEGLLRVSNFGVDGGVLVFVVTVTTLAGLLFGVAPSLFARRTGPGDVLREGGRTGAPGRGTRRIMGGLVVGEVALALLLVVGAGLLIRSFLALRDVDPGFDPDGVLAVTVALPSARYGEDAVPSFFRQLLERARALPGVESAGATSNVPLVDRGFTSDFSVEGRAPDRYGTEVVHRRTLPGYFRTMHVPLREGRLLTEADGEPGAPPVVVVNQALADEYFPGQDPIGRRIDFQKVPDSTSVWTTIVGVVGSERQTGVATPPQIEAYVPLGQDPTGRMSMVLRTTGDPSALTPQVRALVHEMDPNLPLLSVKTMDVVWHDALARERFLMTLLLAFAGVALFLALVGVYGVTAQAARRRTKEIGIRIALGADAGQVVRLALGQGLVLMGLGLGIGIVAALAATRLMSSLLYQVGATDPLTYLAVAVLLGGTGLLASWLPAQRASRVDPAEVLRVE